MESLGAVIEFIPVNEQGLTTPEMLRSMMDDDVALVSVMWANNETGLVFPVHELAAVAHEFGALFHSDGVQAIGKLPVDLHASGVDFSHFLPINFMDQRVLVVSSSKQNALDATSTWGSQMGGRRSGTVAVPLIVGMSAALEVAVKNLDKNMAHMSYLRDKLEESISNLPDITIVGKDSPRTPNTSLVSFKGVEGEAFYGISMNTVLQQVLVVPVVVQIFRLIQLLEL